MRLRVIFVGLTVLCFVSSAWGAMDALSKPEAVLEEIVVTAAREKAELRRIPAHVTVITQEQIEALRASTLIEVLDRVEGIHFRDYSGNSPQAMIDMRGFGGENPFGKTLIMLNGRRLNRPDMSSINWLEIPVSQVERIEVVRGTGSVLYGDGAVAGVVNIITRTGKGKPTGGASTTVGSYGLHDERLWISGSQGRLSYALSGMNRFSFGYRERSKSSFQGGALDMGYEVSPKNRLSLGVDFSQNQYELPGALTKAQMAISRRQYQPGHENDDGKDRDEGMNIRWESDFGAKGRFSLQLTNAQRDVVTDMDSWWQWTNIHMTKQSVSPQYTWEKEFSKSLKNKVTVGLDWLREPYKKDLYANRERKTKYAWADMEKGSLGLYARDEVTVGERLILTAGYRKERARIEGSYTDIYSSPDCFSDREKIYHAEAWELGGTYLVGKRSKVYARYSTVYRFPFLDEVASMTGFPGTGFLTTLEKEKGKSWEMGTEVYPVRNLKLGVALYRIDMSDEITYVGIFPTGYNQNIGQSRHDGAEVNFTWNPWKFVRLYGNATYQKATFEDGEFNKKEIPLVPNRLANLGLEIFLPHEISIRPEVRYVGACFLSQDNANTGEKLGSYTLLNLYLSYRPKIRDLNFHAFLGIENLTGVEYESFGIDMRPWSANAYYPMPKATVKGGLSFYF
ncbi:MAG TPA: TonB-dependent receptor [Syntrophales bacterium]|nr:TonB-dependent receptor [Syntrophales bacterium]